MVSSDVNRRNVRINVTAGRAQTRSFNRARRIDRCRCLSICSSANSSSSGQGDRLLDRANYRYYQGFLRCRDRTSNFFRRAHVLGRLFDFYIFFNTCAMDSMFVSELERRSRISRRKRSNASSATGRISSFFATFRLRNVNVYFFRSTSDVTCPIGQIYLVEAR